MSPPFRLPRALPASYLVALCWGSLYPLSGWRDSGAGLLGFLTDPWPRWWTAVDVIFNIAIYLPAGMLACMLVRERRPQQRALPLALLICSLVALLLEALQSLLPGRVPSRLDWLANSAGALFGALLAPQGERWAARWQQALDARMAMTRGHSAIGSLLLGTWVLVQWPPQRLLFGQGDLEALLHRLPQAIAGIPATPAGWRLAASESVFVEALAVASATVGIGMLVREVLPTRSPRGGITAGVLIAGLLLKTAASAAMFGAQRSLVWLTAGAQGGLLTGAVVLALLAPAQRSTRLRFAIAAFLVTGICASVFPIDAYFASAIAERDPGGWRNLEGLLRGGASLWPYAAVLWCLVRLRALRRMPSPSPDL